MRTEQNKEYKYIVDKDTKQERLDRDELIRHQQLMRTNTDMTETTKQNIIVTDGKKCCVNRVNFDSPNCFMLF